MTTNKAITRLEKELAKKQELLASLEVKRNDIDENIKDTKASISETKADIDREKLDLLKSGAKRQGMSVDDLLALILGDDNSSTSVSDTLTEAESSDVETVSDTENTYV